MRYLNLMGDAMDDFKEEVLQVLVSVARISCIHPRGRKLMSSTNKIKSPSTNKIKSNSKFLWFKVSFYIWKKI